MKTSTNLLFLLLFSASFAAEAQQQKILAMSTLATAPAEDTTAFGVPILDSATVFTATMSVVLASTDSIYQLHVKLGSTLHGTEFLSTSFDYGANGTFGATTYSQTGNSIQLGLGTHAGMISYFSDVQIEKTDHSFEDVITFSNN